MQNVKHQAIMMDTYLVMLLVTAEQEQAIRVLFDQKGWKFFKTGTRQPLKEELDSIYMSVSRDRSSDGMYTGVQPNLQMGYGDHPVALQFPSISSFTKMSFLTYYGYGVNDINRSQGQLFSSLESASGTSESLDFPISSAPEGSSFTTGSALECSQSMDSTNYISKSFTLLDNMDSTQFTENTTSSSTVATPTSSVSMLTDLHAHKNIIPDTSGINSTNIASWQSTSRTCEPDNVQSSTVVDNVQSITGIDNVLSSTGIDNVQSSTVVDNVQSITGIDNVLSSTGIDNVQSSTVDNNVQSITGIDNIQSSTVVDKIQSSTVVDNVQSSTEVNTTQKGDPQTNTISHEGDHPVSTQRWLDVDPTSKRLLERRFDVGPTSSKCCVLSGKAAQQEIVFTEKEQPPNITNHQHQDKSVLSKLITNISQVLGEQLQEEHRHGLTDALQRRIYDLIKTQMNKYDQSCSSDDKLVTVPNQSKSPERCTNLSANECTVAENKNKDSSEKRNITKGVKNIQNVTSAMEAVSSDGVLHGLQNGSALPVDPILHISSSPQSDNSDTEMIQDVGDSGDMTYNKSATLSIESSVSKFQPGCTFKSDTNNDSKCTSDAASCGDDVYRKRKRRWAVNRNIRMHGCHRKCTTVPHDLDGTCYSQTERGFCCTDCMFIFRTEKQFKLHKLLKGGQCSPDCIYCDKDNLADVYQCTKCPKCFKTDDLLQKHMERHASSTYACHLCECVFQTGLELKSHTRSSHVDDTEVLHLCDLCGAKFNERKVLNAHRKYVHTNERPEVCLTCGCGFKTKSQLKNHLVKHKKLDEINLSCEICGKMFLRVATLKDHVRRHKKDFTLYCSVCNKGFYKKYELDDHMRVHTGVKPFDCKWCNYKCALRCNLVKHMKIHKERKNCDNIVC